MLQWTWEYRHLFKIVILFPTAIYPEVGLLDHMVVLFLISWRTSILFSLIAVPVYITTNSMQGFPFCHILANACYLFLLMAILTGVRGYLVVLMFISWWLVMLSTFSCTYWALSNLLGQMSIQVFCLFLKLDLFFIYWVVWVPYIYSMCDSFIGYMICKYFLPFYRLPFHSTDFVL